VKITACVIAKNEEKNIGRWMENMQQIADEIIVVDTGSEDKTVAIAKKSGAKVEYFAWINDFAAAKNFALTKATGHWILFLDADEYFADEAIPLIRPMLKKLDPYLNIGGVMTKLVNLDTDHDNQITSTAMQIRIFRNLPPYCFRGKVHEMIYFPPGKKTELRQDIVICHTGYSAGLMQAKLKRNLGLMEARIKDQGGVIKAQDEQYYMDIWYGLDDRERAASYAQKIIARSDAPELILGRAYETLITIYMEENRDEAVVLPLMAAAQKKFPHRSDFVLMQGIYLAQKRADIVKSCLTRGLDIYSKNEKTSSKSLSPDNAERLLPEARRILGTLL